MNQETKTFSDLNETKKWIKEQYGKSKRVPMYIDTKEGESKKVGYIFGFRNSDCSHYPVEKWIQQDWVHFREVKDLYL